MDELEEARKKKLREIQGRLQEESIRQEQIRQYEEQKSAVLKQILDPDARSRLTTIKLAKPEYGAKLESLLIQMAQGGQIRAMLTDAQFKNILMQAQKKKRDINIRRI